MADSQHKVKFHNPPNKLREKVGYGGMDPLRVERAEAFIDENELDFTPYAEKYIATLHYPLYTGRQSLLIFSLY